MSKAQDGEAFAVLFTNERLGSPVKLDLKLIEADQVTSIQSKSRRDGGADGIVFACRPEIEGVADIGARFLEADGSEAALCGNGTACFIRWSTAQGMHKGEVKILTPAGVVRGQELDDEYVRVCIPLPEDERSNLEIEVDGSVLECDYVVTGVEHLVTYVDDIRRTPVDRLGPALRHHKYFPQPQGVNVNFAQVLGEGELALRTWEYGVEGETLACGTGSAAAALLAAKRFDWPREYTCGDKPVLVHAPSGDVLRVYFATDSSGAVTDPCLETIVRCIFTGTLCPDLAVMAMNETGSD